MNEALQNLFGRDVNIGTEKGIEFSVRVLQHMRDRLVKYQEETGHLYNLEATPAESTSYSLALKDKRKYPDIITAGTDDTPYYTNSTQLPVNYTDDPFEAAELQEPIQKLYTGGTTQHFFLGERITASSAKLFVKKCLRTSSFLTLHLHLHSLFVLSMDIYQVNMNFVRTVTKN